MRLQSFYDLGHGTTSFKGTPLSRQYCDACGGTEPQTRRPPPSWWGSRTSVRKAASVWEVETDGGLSLKGMRGIWGERSFRLEAERAGLEGLGVKLQV